MSMVLAASALLPAPQPPRLLDQVRERALARFGRPEPGERYADWARRFVIFHGMRHLRDLFNADVGRFLQHVAQTEKDPLRPWNWPSKR